VAVEGGDPGKLTVEYINVTYKASILDYLLDNVKLRPFFAIDFTASNGVVERSSSLHHHAPTQVRAP
jgi:hypothetical protein